MRIRTLLFTAVVLTAIAPLHADDRPVLQETLQDNLLKGDWIYDDADAGFAEAAKTGKPLLISFRCVP